MQDGQSRQLVAAQAHTFRSSLNSMLRHQKCFQYFICCYKSGSNKCPRPNANRHVCSMCSLLIAIVLNVVQFAQNRRNKVFYTRVCFACSHRLNLHNSLCTFRELSVFYIHYYSISLICMKLSNESNIT